MSSKLLGAKGTIFLKKGTEEYRRYLVAQYLAHLTSAYRTGGYISEMLRAEHGLEVAESTINEDIAAIRDEWSKSRLQNFEEIIETELIRLDNLEMELIEAWENSKRPMVDKTTVEEAIHVSVGTDSVPAKLIRTTIREYSRNPDPRYAAAMLAVQEARRKLLLRTSKYLADTPKDADQKVINVTLKIGTKVIKSGEVEAEITEESPTSNVAIAKSAESSTKGRLASIFEKDPN